jgi:hypothetical protein
VNVAIEAATAKPQAANTGLNAAMGKRTASATTLTPDPN